MSAQDIATTTNPLYTEIEAFLMRGTNLKVTNVGRLDPSTETQRRKGGATGAQSGVRLYEMEGRTTDPILNPYAALRFRDSYRLGDMMHDTKSEKGGVLGGR